MDQLKHTEQTQPLNDEQLKQADGGYTWGSKKWKFTCKVCGKQCETTYIPSNDVCEKCK